MSRERPEFTGPPELYYNDDVASKYSCNSHTIKIQTEMTERALELCALPEGKPCFLLDVGCGSGLSGAVLSSHGHQWVGLDIAEPMLKIAKEDEDEAGEGDVILKDMGTGIPFRPGTFDGCVSISAIQWLCHANSSDENPHRRLMRFFQSLYACMGRGSRSVFQFYPTDEKQTEFIMSVATKAGFNGGLVVDYPNSTKAKKIYLVLMTGGVQQLPLALTGEEQQGQTQVDNLERRQFQMVRRGGKYKAPKGSREWIRQKMERREKKGLDCKAFSKFSGRQRKPKF